MSPLLVVLMLDLVSAPQCVTSGSQLACGYHCASSLGRLACAQTPEGLCASTPSKVVCWDPPPDVRQVLLAHPELERPKCITGLHGAACGFHCAQSGDRVACASSPWGACGWRFGEVRCWDPPPEVRWAMASEDNLTAASCERTLSDVVCGYHCVATLDQIRCAASPWGMCERRFETLACWDPAFAVPMASNVDRR